MPLGRTGAFCIFAEHVLSAGAAAKTSQPKQAAAREAAAAAAGAVAAGAEAVHRAERHALSQAEAAGRCGGAAGWRAARVVGIPDGQRAAQAGQPHADHSGAAAQAKDWPFSHILFSLQEGTDAESMHIPHVTNGVLAT